MRIGVYGVLRMLGALAMGRWVDRVGPFVPMRAGIAAVVVGVVLPVMLPGVPTLFVTAILSGVGFNMVSVAAQYSVGHLSNSTPADRVANFGWLALGHSASSIAGPILVGIVIDLLGHRSAFAILAVGASVAAALVIKYSTQLAAVHVPRHSETPGNVWQLMTD